jgi:2-methylcitrate dehydratase PrpD
VSDHTVAFIHDLAFSQIPEATLENARRCLLDTIGVAAGAVGTDAGRIVRDHVAAFHCPAEKGARMLFDGRRVAPPGAAMAGAAMIDSLDGHDGQRNTKGHMGVVVVPALLALADEIARGDAAEFLTRLVLGYEIGTRAGMALHATVPEYHTSGAWNAVAAAAMGARALGLDGERTRHALGTAEYYGPRSQMMRCIDHPSMVKDGSTMGGYVGLSAALLAGQGFTGAPAVTVEDAAVIHLWQDLGSRWRMDEQYIKVFPVCHWAHAPAEAVLSLRQRAPAAEVEAITVYSFHNAVRLAMREPENTDDAQYSLPFCVAAALVHGRIGAAEIDGDGLRDAEVLRLSRGLVLIEDDACNARYPAQLWARAEILMKDGRVLRSEEFQPRGSTGVALPDADVDAKFDILAGPALGSGRAARLLKEIRGLNAGSDLGGLIDDLLSAPA